MHQTHEFRVLWGGLGAFVEKNLGVTSWHELSLISLIHHVLHRVSCVYEMIPNAPKHYAMHQNMSLWSNGADWVRSLRKIPIWLHGTNFCINCTSSRCFAPSFMQLRNDPKCTQTLWNTQKMSLGSNGVDQVRSLQKVQTWHRGTNFCINCTCTVCFATSFMQLRNDLNAPKYYKTDRNISLGSNGLDGVR